MVSNMIHCTSMLLKLNQHRLQNCKIDDEPFFSIAEKRKEALIPGNFEMK